jgi:tRNA pseudouridine32 synthase/23S rRNA pseudouridine746 synthase
MARPDFPAATADAADTADAGTGVGASRVRVPADARAPTLLDFLCARFAGVERDQWRARLAAGRVHDAAGHRYAADAPTPRGALVHYYREVPDEAPIAHAATVLHRDAHLLVVDKPHFLPTVPSGRFVTETLLARLRRDTGLNTLVPLHRLDRMTAGLVLFSIDPASRAAYHALFAERRIVKHYEALAPYREDLPLPCLHRSRLVPCTPFFRVREAVDGEPNSETRIECLERRGALARYRLTPVTGRKHQLRAHMAALGIPIVNDRWYPVLLDDRVDDPAAPLKLVARRLAFTDPVTGEARQFDSRFEV